MLFDELDALKDRVKRLRLKSTQPLPKVPHIRGALRVQVDGDRALVSVAEFSDEFLAELRERFHAEISVENLNLEDIFLELHHE